jgi:hypothetical protein
MVCLTLISQGSGSGQHLTTGPGRSARWGWGAQQSRQCLPECCSSVQQRWLLAAAVALQVAVLRLPRMRGKRSPGCGRAEPVHDFIIALCYHLAWRAHGEVVQHHRLGTVPLRSLDVA